MPTLGSMLADAKAGRERFVTPYHVQWQEMSEDEQVYSEEALEHVMKVLRKEYKHPRAGRFSPSAMGECDRAVVFGFAGAPQAGFDLDNVEMMEHGSWSHLRWQAEAITMGWMTAGEAWTYDPDTLAGGSMDGVMIDESIFELKTAGSFVYTRIVNTEREPTPGAVFQVDTYLVLSDRDTASIVYENRSGGQFHEFRHHRTREGDNRVIRTLNSYNAYVENDELPPMLDGCEMRQGPVYRRCPFRKVCPRAHSVSEFGQVT